MPTTLEKRRYRPQASQSKRPASLALLSVAVIASGLCTIGIWFAFSRQWSWQPWLFAWLVGINVTALGFYAFDKSRAKRSRTRVPEALLYGLAFAGGSVGAYAGMHLFRHKTAKGRFQFVFWAIVLLQVGLLASIVRYVFFPGGN
jgi:uncharacterized membrane protein YsdA (DUF1294 family)